MKWMKEAHHSWLDKMVNNDPNNHSNLNNHSNNKSKEYHKLHHNQYKKHL